MLSHLGLSCSVSENEKNISWRQQILIYQFVSCLNSEEEAKKKIYNVSCERYFGFGCEIDEETSNKLEGQCVYQFTDSVSESLIMPVTMFLKDCIL